MNAADWIDCPMCGYRFDPAEHAACGSCPLNRSCQLVCCPVCGFETIDPGRSTLARLATRFFARRREEPAPAATQQPACSSEEG